jgi:transcriptional regulator with XRE-family HTH domain
MTSDNNRFGRFIAERRKKLTPELSQKDLARKVGISTAYMNDIERGRRNPPVPKLYELAIALEVDSDLLFVLVGTLPNDIQALPIELVLPAFKKVFRF